MAISFVAAGSVANSTNPVVSAPAGIAAGDLLVIVTAGTAASTISTSSYPGWTRIASQGAGQFICVHTKIASGLETSVTMTQTGATSSAVMIAYRGCGWYDVIASFNTGTSTSPATLTQTTGFANDYVTSIYSATVSPGVTWSAIPASTTSRVNYSPATFRGLLIVDELKATAGATTARTATLSSSIAWSSVSISIREPQTCYWVGAAGTWDSTTKTNWAKTSGGAGGALVPGYDNVVFDANSNTGTTAWTVTMSASDYGRCNDFSTSGLDATMTLAWGTTTYRLIAYGNVTFPATNFATSGAGNSSGGLLISAVGSKTLTTNSLNCGRVVIYGSGTTTLGSALLCYNFSIYNGTFTTSGSNYNITASAASNSTNSFFTYVNAGFTATLTLNSSTLTFGAWNITDSTGLTLNAGTSTISVTAGNSTFAGGNLTYYNASITSNGIALSGNNTFTNLTFTKNTVGISEIGLDQGGSTTVTGTLTTSGSTAARRIILYSGLYALGRNASTDIPHTITAAAVSLTNCDFYNIIGAGTASWTGTSIGNIGLNTNITFTAPKTVYFVDATPGTFGTTASTFATSSGGTASDANTPLPQDTVIVDNSSYAVSSALSFDAGGNYIPYIDASTRTLATSFTINTGGTTPVVFNGGLNLGSGVTLGGFAYDFYILGNFTLNASTTVTSLNTVIFGPLSTTTQTITINGNTNFRTNTSSVTFRGNSLGATIALSGDMTFTTASTVNADVNTASSDILTLDLSGGSLTVDNFSASIGTRTIAFGSNSITATGSGASTISINAGTGTFAYTGTPNLVLAYTGSVSTTVSLVSFTESNALNLNVNGPGSTYSLTANNIVVKDLIFTSFGGTLSNSTRTIYGSLTLATGMTITAGSSTTTFAATSGSYTITPNGVTMDNPVTFGSSTSTATWQLAGAFNIGLSRTLTFSKGSFVANTYNVTCGAVASSASGNIGISMGSGTWSVLSSGTVWDLGSNASLTLNAGTSTIAIASTSGGVTRTFGATGNLARTYYNLLIGGGPSVSQITNIYGGNTFNTISSNKTVAHQILFETGKTVTVSDFTVSGSSGNLVTLDRIGASGSWSIAKSGGGVISSVSYLSITRSNASPSLTWYAGAGSVNGGTNTGWIFSTFGASSNFFLLF